MSIDPANAATPLLQHGERLENASLILSGLNQGYPLTREGRNSLDATLTSGSLGLVVDCFQQEYEALAPNSTFVERRFEFLIKPACAVVGQLLSMLVNGNFQPAQLSSYVLLLPAANEINEYLFYVDESESPANQDLTSALGSAMVLIFAAREYIDYRYDARQLAYVIPANSLALQVAQSFLIKKSSSNPPENRIPSKHIPLCAHILLALAGLPENGDWRRVGSLQEEMSNAEIIACMAAKQSMQPSRGKATVRNNAINALLDAGVIARKGDPKFSSELRNIKYVIHPQTLAALQQLTASGAW